MTAELRGVMGAGAGAGRAGSDPNLGSPARLAAGADDPCAVQQTIGNRPEVDTLPPLADPAADHTSGPLAARRADVEEKHRRIIAFLDATGYDAVVLGRADSI